MNQAYEYDLKTTPYSWGTLDGSIICSIMTISSSITSSRLSFLCLETVPLETDTKSKYLLTPEMVSEVGSWIVSFFFLSRICFTVKYPISRTYILPPGKSCLSSGVRIQFDELFPKDACQHYLTVWAHDPADYTVRSPRCWRNNRLLAELLLKVLGCCLWTRISLVYGIMRKYHSFQ